MAYSPSMLCLIPGRPVLRAAIVTAVERVAVNPAPDSRPAFRFNVGKSGNLSIIDGHLCIRRLKTADLFSCVITRVKTSKV